MGFFKNNVLLMKKNVDVNGLNELLKSETKLKTRMKAARALGEIGDANSIQSLIKALEFDNNYDADLYIVILDALKRINNADSIDPLIQLFGKCQNRTVSNKIADTLISIGGDRALYAIIDFAMDGKKDAQAAANLVLDSVLKNIEDVKARFSIFAIFLAASLKNDSNFSENTLDKILNSNTTGNDGSNALQNAVGNDHSDIVKDLLLKGTDSNIKNNLGLTAMLKASLMGSYDVVEILINFDTNLNNRDKKTGESPLYNACMGSHINVAKLLLAKGADPNAETLDGVTPLMVAVHKNNIDLVKLLTNYSTDIDKKNKSGETAFHFSADEGDVSIVEHLLKHGASINIQDDSGITPLFCACRGKHNSTVDKLLEEGADPNIVLNDGYSPLMSAASRGNSQMIRSLLAHNADVNHRSEYGSTAINCGLSWSNRRSYIAKGKPHMIEIVEAQIERLLEEAGALPEPKKIPKCFVCTIKTNDLFPLTFIYDDVNEIEVKLCKMCFELELTKSGAKILISPKAK